jgi:hypothetical protein
MPIEHIETECDVCGSDFGEGPQKVDCLRINLPHLAAWHACVCLDCAKVIAEAAEEEGLT